jgi:hypothetical protein
LLDETDYGERWRPLREALQAIAEDDSSYLLRVAPEIRQPAEEIIAMLLPEGSRLGGVPKSTRAADTAKEIARLKWWVNCDDSNITIQNHSRQQRT